MTAACALEKAGKETAEAFEKLEGEKVQRITPSTASFREPAVLDRLVAGEHELL